VGLGRLFVIHLQLTACASFYHKEIKSESGLYNYAP